jgi:hypothetical protein
MEGALTAEMTVSRERFTSPVQKVEETTWS